MNLTLWTTSNGIDTEDRIDLHCAYNAKASPYPLLFSMNDGVTQYPVFNDDGTLSDDFCCHVLYVRRQA